ncbi:MAG: hypothetical protein U0P45_05305 [Acidimicrobiales bacterium]
MLRKRGGGKGDKVRQPSPTYLGLRQQALELPPGAVDASGTAHPDVLGVVVDIPSDRDFLSLTVLADGTTSMYTSPGGGTIGAGAHQEVREAGALLLGVLQGILDQLPRTDEVSLPPAELVLVTVLTPEGRRRAGVPLDAFWGREPSGVVALIAAIHEVISAIREVDPG